MSWKFPESILGPNKVITEEGLNDGFVPAAMEAQGRINEHNLKSGIITGTSWGSGGDKYIPDTNVEAANFGLEYVNTRGTNQTAAEGGTGATRGAWCVIDDVTGHNNTGDKPELDGGIRIDLTPAWSVLGAKEPPFQRPVGETTPRPMQVSFFAEEKMSLWIMSSFQVQDANGFGQMFCLRVNGAVVTESIFGTADLQNDRIDVDGWSVKRPNAEVLNMSPSAGATGNEIGYPVCVECVVDVPPGDVTVEVMGLNNVSVKGTSVSSLPPTSKAVVSSREIIILKMKR